jgi:SWI/SNF-related matrix-associated actin-dependent regulator of chromatin subfamily A-like protein 1
MTQPLFPCQEKAIARIVKGEPVYLAMDMGLGKSRTFIEAVKQRKASRVLILCPASARLVWKREIKRWDPEAVIAMVDRPEGLSTIARYTIVTHGLFSQRNGTVIGAFSFCPPFQMTAIDEAHAFNSPDSLRVKALKRLPSKFGYIIPLSGTPIRNHSGDLFNMLQLCYPQGLKSGNGGTLHRLAFEDQFCRVVNKVFNNHHVRVIEGSKNLEALKSRIDPFMIRVRKSEVLKDLPPILWDHVSVPLSEVNASIFETAQDLSRVLLDAAMSGIEAELLSTLGKEAHIMKLRRLLGLAKLRGACDYLMDMLDNLPEERKVLVFGVHTDVIGALKNHLGEHNPAVIIGATSPKDRETEVERFLQLAPCRVFIGNIQAAGTALTLVGPKCKCSDVVFVESSWTSADNAQAACRIHRIGQHDGVVARMLTTDHPVDELIHRILVRKAREFSQLFDAKGEV